MDIHDLQYELDKLLGNVAYRTLSDTELEQLYAVHNNALLDISREQHRREGERSSDSERLQLKMFEEAK